MVKEKYLNYINSNSNDLASRMNRARDEMCSCYSVELLEMYSQLLMKMSS